MQMYTWTILIGALLILPSNGEKTYKHERVLDGGHFTMRWTPDSAKNIIDFELEVKTNGWIGLTFYRASEFGGFADTVFAGVYDNLTTHYIQDRWTDQTIGEPFTPRPFDTQIDWIMNYFSQADGKTVVGISRAMDTNDYPADQPAFLDEELVIRWAYDFEDITAQGDALYHGGDRGTIRLNLINPVPEAKSRAGVGSSCGVLLVLGNSLFLFM